MDVGASVGRSEQPARDLAAAVCSLAAADLRRHPSRARPPRRTGGVHAPIHVIACFDTVELHRDGESTVVLGGLSAQLISELVAFAGPVSWVTVARALWPRDDEEGSLRRRWDVALARLRSRLRAERLRPDLVHADGSGQVTPLATRRLTRGASSTLTWSTQVPGCRGATGMPGARANLICARTSGRGTGRHAADHHRSP